MESIILNVDDASGMAYRNLNPAYKKQFNVMAGLILKKIINAPKISTYQQMLDEIGKEAEANGLKPAILDELLNSNND